MVVAHSIEYNRFVLVQREFFAEGKGVKCLCRCTQQSHGALLGILKLLKTKAKSVDVVHSCLFAYLCFLTKIPRFIQCWVRR